MKVEFDCQAKVFKNVMRRALRFIPTGTNPNKVIRVEAMSNKSTLEITATKSDMTYRESIAANVEKSGVLYLDAAAVKEALKIFSTAFKKGIIKFLFDDLEGDFVRVEINECKASIPVIDCKKYAFVKCNNENTLLELEGAEVREILSQVVWACSDDVLRLLYCGAYLTCDGDTLSVVSTNTHRMVVWKTLLSRKIKAFGFVAPKQALVELARFLKGSSGVVTLSEGDNDCASFSFGGQKITFKKREGEFPRYENAIPKKTKTKVKASTSELVAAIEKMLFAVREDDYKAVKMQVDDFRIIFTPLHGGHGEFVEVPCESWGNKDLTIAFNSYYLLDKLKAMAEGSKAVIKLIDGTSPAVITSSPYDKALYVITPIRMDQKKG